MPATPRISISPSPSRTQSSWAASSLSFTRTDCIGSRVADRDALEEFRETLQPEPLRHVEQPRLAHVRIELREFPQLTERRTRSPAPRDAAQAMGGATHRQEMADSAKPEI